MAITVKCGECRHAYKVGEEFIGQWVKCTHCGKVFLVGKPKAVPVAGPTVSRSDDPFADAPFEPPREQKPSAPPPWKLPSVARDELPASSSKAADAPSHGARYTVRGAGEGLSLFGADRLTAYLVLFFILCSLVIGISITVQRFNSNQAGGSTALLWQAWGWIAVFDALYFLIVSPLLLTGVFATSKIFNSKLVDGAYLRACGVAAVPTLLLAVGGAIGGPVQWLAYLAIIPVGLFILKHIFNLDWPGAAVSFVLGMAGWIVGLIITVFCLSFILSGGVLTLLRQSPEPDAASSTVPSNSRAPSNSSAAQVPAAVAETSPLVQLRDLVTSRTNVDLSEATNEERAADVAELKRQVESLRATHHQDPEWQSILATVREFERKVATLPSNTIDPAIFVQPTDIDDWTTGSLSRGKLAGEVSFKQFNLQPPMDMRLDVRSFPGVVGGLTWTSPTNPIARLSIYTLPRGNKKQWWPLITDKPALLRVAKLSGLLAIAATDVTPTFGQINGNAFARISVESDTPGKQWTEYISPVGDQWLIIHLVPPADDRPLAKLLDAAARTVRLRDPAEKPANAPATKAAGPAGT